MTFRYLSVVVSALVFIGVTMLNSVLAATLASLKTPDRITTTFYETSTISSQNDQYPTTIVTKTGFLRGAGGGDKIYSNPGTNFTLAVIQKPHPIMLGGVIEKLFLPVVTQPPGIPTANNPISSSQSTATQLPKTKTDAPSSTNINTKVTSSNYKQDLTTMKTQQELQKDQKIQPQKKLQEQQQKPQTLFRMLQSKQQQQEEPEVEDEPQARQIGFRKKDNKNWGKNANKGNGRNSNANGKSSAYEATTSNSKKGNQKGTATRETPAPVRPKTSTTIRPPLRPLLNKPPQPASGAIKNPTSTNQRPSMTSNGFLPPSPTTSLPTTRPLVTSTPSRNGEFISGVNAHADNFAAYYQEPFIASIVSTEAPTPYTFKTTNSTTTTRPTKLATIPSRNVDFNSGIKTPLDNFAPNYQESFTASIVSTAAPTPHTLKTTYPSTTSPPTETTTLPIRNEDDIDILLEAAEDPTDPPPDDQIAEKQPETINENPEENTPFIEETGAIDIIP